MHPSTPRSRVRNSTNFTTSGRIIPYITSSTLWRRCSCRLNTMVTEGAMPSGLISIRSQFADMRNSAPLHNADVVVVLVPAAWVVLRETSLEQQATRRPRGKIKQRVLEPAAKAAATRPRAASGERARPGGCARRGSEGTATAPQKAKSSGSPWRRCRRSAWPL